MDYDVKKLPESESGEKLFKNLPDVSDIKESEADKTHKTLPAIIGDCIKWKLDKLGKTQKQLAKETYISEGMISKIINANVKKTSLDNLLVIADNLDISMDLLFGRTIIDDYSQRHSSTD